MSERIQTFSERNQFIGCVRWFLIGAAAVGALFVTTTSLMVTGRMNAGESMATIAPLIISRDYETAVETGLLGREAASQLAQYDRDLGKADKWTFRYASVQILGRPCVYQADCVRNGKPTRHDLYFIGKACLSVTNYQPVR